MKENNAKMPKSDKSDFWSSASDGKMTIGDVLVNLGTLLFFALLGALLAMGAWVAGVEWENARRFVFYAVSVGGAIVTARIILDMLNLAGMVSAWRNRPRLSDFSMILPESPAPGESNPIRPIPVYTSDAKPKPTVELPNGATVTFELLSDYLLTAVRLGGTAWSREYWCNKPDAKKPGLGQLRLAEWTGISQLCRTMNIWRAEDQDVIKEFLKKMKGDLE